MPSAAVTIGLRGKATATPVARCRLGAAWWAAAIDSHGGWRISVNTTPENPDFSTSAARRWTSAQAAGSVITSNCIGPSCRRRGERPVSGRPVATSRRRAGRGRPGRRGRASARGRRGGTWRRGCRGSTARSATSEERAPPATSIARSHTSMPPRATSRLAAITSTTVAIDGVRSSPTVAQRAVEGPRHHPQAVVHGADLALDRWVVGARGAGDGGDRGIAGRLGDAEVDAGDHGHGDADDDLQRRVDDAERPAGEHPLLGHEDVV